MNALRKRKLYNSTLIVFTADNGAQPGGNNYPLRGSKWSSWEGGIRACAFVSGGFLPAEGRGTVQEGLVAAWDWYATFAHLAGEDPTDAKAMAAGLPRIDSFNVWHLISGQTTESPRTHVEIGTSQGGYATRARIQGTPTIGGLVKQKHDTLYKLVLGDTVDEHLE